jgi:hypothetical protein
MARGFGMTALRAALGGVAGYGQDVAARREREKLDAEMARQQERQAAMDQVMLQDKGYLSMGQQERAKQTGGAAVLRAALMGARDQGAIDQGLSAAAPQQTLTLGGQQFTRESPVAAAARAASRSVYEKQQEDKRTKAEKQSTIDEQVKALMATGDYTEAQARAAVVGGVGAYTPLTKAQRADIALRGRQISLAERQAAMAGQPSAGGDNIEKIKRLPVRAQTKLEGIDAGLMMADNLRQMLESNPKAVGLKGVFSNLILSRADPQGVAVRSAIENLSGEIRNQRFGGALTKNEAEFSLQNLPDRRDTAASAMAKLNELVKFLEIKRKAQYNTYGLDYTPTEREGAKAPSRPPLSSFE